MVTNGRQIRTSQENVMGGRSPSAAQPMHSKGQGTGRITQTFFMCSPIAYRGSSQPHSSAQGTILYTQTSSCSCSHFLDNNVAQPVCGQICATKGHMGPQVASEQWCSFARSRLRITHLASAVRSSNGKCSATDCRLGGASWV